MRRAIRLAAATSLAAVPGTALAGPPYATDDPAPTDKGKWEVYSFVAGTHFAHATEGEAGFDINYGAAENLQLTTVVPFAYEHEHGRGAVGLGDIEAGVKYRFARQREDGSGLDVSVYPVLGLPTGGRRFGSGKVGAFLPIWAQKDFGKWSMFGGGGYAINPGEDGRDAWFVGYALTRQVTERLNLGAEIYHQTREARGSEATTALGFGAIYTLGERWSLLGSIGPGIAHRAANGRYSFYLGLAFHD